MRENMMGQNSGPGADMDIDTDDRQQRKEWILQRIAWLVFTLLLVGIALGLLGRGGPLSEVYAVSEDDAFTVRYERFLRNESTDTLRVMFRADEDTVRVRLDSDYLDHVQLQRITPQPARVVAHKEALVYEFHAIPGDQVQILFHFMPEKVGRLRGWAAVDNGPPRHFSQFVYP